MVTFFFAAKWKLNHISWQLEATRMVESTLHRVHTDFNATLCSKYEQKKRFKDRLFKILASYNSLHHYIGTVDGDQ